jgi:hypothetical protein
MADFQKFYLTLPSNVKSDEYVETNRITNYKTSLSKRIEFSRDEKWEVGLAEISYTKSWFNVRNYIKFLLFDQTGEYFDTTEMSNIEMFIEVPISAADKIRVETKKKLNIPMYSRPGYYRNAQFLCDLINEELYLIEKHCSQCPKLIYNEYNHHVILKPGICNKIVFFPDFGEEINNILGLIDNKNLSVREKAKHNYINISSGNSNSGEIYTDVLQVFGNGELRGYRPVELNAGLTSLYIYSNIVEHTCVGNSFSQLLRCVEVPNDKNFGDQINIIYDKPHFIPLQSNCIDIIEIDIKDDTSDNIPFNFGRVTVKLIFQQYGR